MRTTDYESNLPPGVSVRHLPGWEDALGDESCEKCRAYVDTDDEVHTRMDDGTIRCADCRELCIYCGTAFTDDCQVIHLRDNGTGKLQSECIECAGNDWLQRLIDYRAAAFAAFDPLVSLHMLDVQPDSLQMANIEALWAFYVRQG